MTCGLKRPLIEEWPPPKAYMYIVSTWRHNRADGTSPAVGRGHVESPKAEPPSTIGRSALRGG